MLLVQVFKTQNIVLKEACCAQGDVGVCIYVYVHVCGSEVSACLF